MCYKKVTIDLGPPKMITADKARELSESFENIGLEKILQNIEYAAKEGKREIYMNEPFDRFTSKLNELGFTVIDAPSLAIQKDNHYGTIKW